MSRSALLIATGEYRDAGFVPLRAADDVRQLAAVLENPEIGAFDLRPPLVNAELQSVRDEIFDFFDVATVDDDLLLYLSCHGVLWRGRRLFFATRETELSRVPPTAIDADFIKDAVKHSRARAKVLILDCCHSGAFARDALTKGDEDRRVHLERLEEGGGTIILTASDELEQAIEEDRLVELEPGRAPSVFTDVLIEGLVSGKADRDRNGRVTVDELYEWTFARVRERNRDQTPVSFGELRGDIMVARNPRMLLPEGVASHMRDPHPMIRKVAVEQLGDIARGTDERLAQAAREALTALRDDEDEGVSTAARAALGERVPAEAPAPRPTVAAEDARIANLISRGHRHRLARRYKSALACYEDALRTAPDSDEALLGRGDTLRRLHRFSEARLDLDKAVELAPDNVAARIARGELLVERGQAGEALGDLEAALEAQPYSVEARIARGRAHAREAVPAWKAALEDFDEALEADPDNVDALVGRAFALAAMGDPRRAREAIDRARQLDVASSDVWTVSAELREREGSPAARAEVDEALRLDGRNPRALVLLGRLRLVEEDLEGALESFEAAMAIVPDDAAAQYGRARVLLAQERFDDAVEALERTLSMGEVPGQWPQFLDVRVDLGRTLLALGQADAALLQFDEALRADPAHTPALAGRARAHVRNGRPEHAIADYGRALQHDPPDGAQLEIERAQALVALAGRPRELWPEDVVREVDAARERNVQVLAESDVEGDWLPGQLDAVARRITGLEQLLWAGRCARPEDIRRHIVAVVTTRQIVWCRQTPVSTPEVRSVEWTEVREVRPQNPDGFRLVLHSGPRLNFVRLSDAGVDLARHARTMDGHAVRELVQALARDANAPASS